MATTRAGGRHGRPWRAAGTAVVVTLAMIGAGMIGASLKTTPAPRPPQPLAQAGPEVSTPASGTDDAPSLDGQPVDGQPVDQGYAPAGLARSAPTSIEIPRIGVNATIMSLGTNPDGTVQVPPLDQAEKAGWYEPGASPGETGNAVIVGHVDSAVLGPAVFFDLGALTPGDTITVRRADGVPATFTVDSVRSYPKTAFPTELVYGPSDRPGLRVVTCGGQFDQVAKSYPDNIVVFATPAA
ncbi:class F sortase [Micromonospora sp. WMMD1120]|uniref:class F sortase n=1 Tax=Micromonospora sp. WMMD1120 TaxID=3016106 RepID=UPI002416DEFD|nr:class F sortase [Micromonospora sp. WMMD1120]MDG4805881.1 class F sortase [Micromonospora sp. WMMD1120]